MKNQQNALAIAALAVSLVVPLAAQKPAPAQVALKAAIDKEMVDGDLKGAIALYEKTVAQARSDRATAAKALIRMAECHHKLGDAEARKIYARLLREYPDQKEAAAMARARLGGAQPLLRQANTLVWSGPKVGLQGRVSLDGRYVSYTDWNTGDLVLREIAAGIDHRLTDIGKGTGTTVHGRAGSEAEGSAISRDGQQIVYNWFQWDDKSERAELRLASLAGNPNPRRLYGNPDVEWFRPWDWSPDGTRVAVMMWRSDRTQQIGVVSIPDGSLQVLKSVDWRAAAGIFFSPDGKYLGYDLPQKDAGPERDVFVLSVDGQGEIRAVGHPSNDVMMGWSPDGKWLLFASDRTGSTDLWGLPFAQGKAQGAPELLRTNIPMAPLLEPMGVTHSGALYYGIDGRRDRFRIQLADYDFDSGRMSNLTDVTEDYLESNALPSWSPDGRRLAYKSIRGPAQRQAHEVVVIRSIDTGQVRELRPKLSYFGPVQWSPDGRSFLTLGRDLRGRRGIYQIDAETGDTSTVLLERAGERSFYPTWAPDGKSFYFRRDYRDSKDSGYIQYDMGTGRETELIRRRVLSQVDMSPDGRYFASRSVDESTNSRTLLLIAVAGGEVRELVRYPSGLPIQDLADERKGVWLAQGPWAPDSRSFLAFKTTDVSGAGLGTNTSEAWRVPVDGGAPQKVGERFPGHPWAVRRDGRIALTVKETAPRRAPEIWVLENFLPGSK
jgi:Tol biopolymer transport system component